MSNNKALWMHDVDGGSPPKRDDRGVTVNGRAIPPPRRSALWGGSSLGGTGLGSPPYDAGSITDQHFGAWQPYLWSPDAELNIWRDRIVARVRDVVRNDGWASGAVTRILDNAIGPMLRPVAKPDWKLLQIATGNKAFDADWAREFADAVDAYWRSWADDLGRWCDIERNMNFTELMYTAFRHKIIDGDALGVVRYEDEIIGAGRARYGTQVQLIDPDRLSNPQLRFDSMFMRGGVQINERGAAVGYWIRQAHMGDWFNAAKSMTWILTPRETPWGRPIVVHDYDSDRASQHRGGVGIFGPILQRIRMLSKYDGVELDSAIINSIFAAYVESPMDPSMIRESLAAGQEEMSWYQQQRVDWHNDPNWRDTMLLGNSRIATLYPGEKINAVAATRPGTNFKDFEAAVLRNIATGTGLSEQQISQNWEGVNYSSARQALLEAWKTMERRRENFTFHFASPIRVAWMEELMDSETADELPLPAGAPDFIEFRTAYAKCTWMGPGHGWIDPIAEKQGAVLGMQAGLSTLEMECAAQGLDYREVIEQRSHEIQLFEELGIPQPEWTGQQREKELEAQKSQTKEENKGSLPAKPKRPGGK